MKEARLLQPPALVDHGDEVLVVINGLAEAGVVVEEFLLRHLQGGRKRRIRDKGTYS